MLIITVLRLTLASQEDGSNYMWESLRESDSTQLQGLVSNFLATAARETNLPGFIGAMKSLVTCTYAPPLIAPINFLSTSNYDRNKSPLDNNSNISYNLVREHDLRAVSRNFS